jgi:sulfur-carrier protein adenylyltransferase/sulfurtransferase
MGATSPLTAVEIQRYSRHLILPEVGVVGQRKLKAARVLLVGVGGLGSPLALYLAAAGVGTLGLVDCDVVDETNLQRQVLHGTASIGRQKLESAEARLADINPHVRVIRHDTRLSSANALDIVAGYDIVADGTDNFPTRYLVNDACVLSRKPNVYGSIFRFEGQVAVFDAARGPCYRCMFREPPPPGLVPSCAEGGVLGVLPGIIGTLQALETIKLILGVGGALVGRMMLFDAVEARWQELTITKDPTCPVCGPQATIDHLIDYAAFCGIGDGDVPTGDGIRPGEFLRRRAAGEQFTLIDCREPHEWDIVNLEEMGATLVPLASISVLEQVLSRETPIVVHCKSGARSARAVAQLKKAGFEQVWNLDGGILAWSAEVDPSKPRY